MAKLFQRSYSLTMGTHQFSNSLHISFSVERSLQKSPNTAKITVFNLSEASRLALEKTKNTGVRLDVGYGGDNSLIFLGDVRTATSTTEGPDIVTTLECSDGERQIQGSRVAIPVPPKTAPDGIIEKVAASMGLGLGNITDFLPRLQALPIFSGGKAVTGSSAQALDKITSSANLSWSVQSGKIQLIDHKQPLAGQAFLLSSDSGLIGSPSVDSKGVVNAETLFIAGLTPGVKVSFKSRHVNGGYRVEKCTYAGEYAGNAWGIKIEAKKY